MSPRHLSFGAAAVLLGAVIVWPAASQTAPIVVTLSGTVSSAFMLTATASTSGRTGASTSPACRPASASSTRAHASSTSAFTINGITAALDVGGLYENASLQVNNPVNTPTNGVRDGHSLFAGDDRASGCAADRQCVEKAEIYATGYFGQDLFGAEGRYTDGQTHHVEFLRRGTSLSVARQPSGSGGVPEPGSLALVLAACGLGWGVTRRRVG